MQHTPLLTFSGIQFVPDPTATSGSPNATVTRRALGTATQRNQEVVQASASQVIENLTGGIIKPAEQITTSKNPFLSASVPLVQKVSEKIRKQIWAKEYVDFATLFHVNEYENQYVLKISNQ